MYLSAQDFNDELLCLRLRLLRKSRLIECPSRPVYRGRGGLADDRILSAQLHRRVVSVLRRFAVLGLYDGGNGSYR